MKVLAEKPLGKMQVYDLCVDNESHSFLLANMLTAHNSGYVVANRPIQEFIPTTTISGVRTTADTANWVEMAGGIKIDILGVNSLKDIEIAIKLMQKQIKWAWREKTIDGKRVPALRQVLFNDKIYDIWDLPESEDVFRSICSGDVDKSIFQFGGDAAKQFLGIFLDGDKPLLKSISDLATFTALARPGPLDAFVEADGVRRNMLEEFAARARGEEPIGNNPTLDKMFPETYGIIAFQEQLTKAFKVIGKTTGIQAENFRVHTSKKQAAEVIKDKVLFMPGAIETLGSESEAQRIWDMLETFARYGFNKSHAVAYSHIGYATAWLRHYFPLEWWTAVLRNADRNEIDKRFWKHCGHLVDLPDVALSGEHFEIQGERIRAPLSMLNGVGPAAHTELQAIKPYSNIQEFCDKVYALKVTKAVITEEGKTRLGRSALNRGIMTKLILSGAADSLFPPDMGVYDKLVAYSEAFMVSNKKRKPEPIDPRLMNLGPLQRFLLKKEVLPAYKEELVPTVAITHNVIRRTGDGFVFLAKNEVQGDGRIVPVVHGDKLTALQEIQEDSFIRAAVVAYVSDVEWFWDNKAAKINFDVNGQKFQAIKWPDREPGSPKKAIVPSGVENSVAVLCLNRFKAGKGFSVDDIVIVQAALNLKAEESA